MKVSIITPFYHGMKYIPGLLRMVKENAQNCKILGIATEIEYIIINDSPDITLNIVNPYKEYFYLKIITNSINAGIHRSRVNGLNAAGGEYIIFFDQDDILLPKAVASSIKKAKGADLIISNGYHSNGNADKKIYRNYIAHWMATKLVFYAYCTSMIVSPGQVMIKKDSIPTEWKQNIMKHNGSDDYFLWLLMFDKGVYVLRNSEYVYKHVYTNQNVSLDRKKMYESSQYFCSMAEKSKLLSQKLLKKIVRRTNLKIEWNFEIKSFQKKWFVATKNLDIILINFVYKIFYH